MSSLRRVLDGWRRLDVTVRDLPLALLLATAALIPALQGLGTAVGELPTRPFDALAFVVIVLQSLPLALRRRWPALCLGLVSVGLAIDQLRGYHTFAGAGLAIALLSAGAHLERRRRTVAVLLTAGYVGLAFGIDRLGGTEHVLGYAGFYLALVGFWVIGAWLRSTRAVEAERRLRVAEDTRAAERSRIARELHDVVTHHVTAMVVQAESARYLTAAPDRLEAALAAVTDTGREAISDLRNLLDLLDPGHDGADRRPSRTALGGDVATLVEQARRAGQPVELLVDGTPRQNPGTAEHTAHRVVQEALTNALKHAAGRPTVVDVRYVDEAITVRVSTAGAAGSGPAPGAGPGPGPGLLSRSGSGRGLVGLRERVDALGGDFDAAPLADGGFVVRAVLPRPSAGSVDRP